MIEDSHRMGVEVVYKEVFVDQIYRRHGIEIEDGDVVLDVGANVGLFSIWLSGFLSRAEIHTFEPVPSTAANLLINLDDHCRLRVIVHDFALASHDGFLALEACTVSQLSGTLFDEAQAIQNALEVGRGWPWKIATTFMPLWLQRIAARWMIQRTVRFESVRVPCRRLDSVFVGDKIDLIKVDVEGGELAVLKGIGSLWPRVRQVVVECHTPELAAGCTELLTKNGFEVVSDAGPASKGLPVLYATRPVEDGVVEKLSGVAVELVGGPADGDVVHCEEGTPVISLSCLGDGFAVYVRRPDGKYCYATKEYRAVGEEIEF